MHGGLCASDRCKSMPTLVPLDGAPWGCSRAKTQRQGVDASNSCRSMGGKEAVRAGVQRIVTETRQVAEGDGFVL